MSFTKKICLFTCIILLILSLYNDIKKNNSFHTQPDQTMNVTENMHTVKVKVQAGDTILSVSERINGDHLQNIKIEDILQDFYDVNQGVKQLTPDNSYFFPVYKHKN